MNHSWRAESGLAAQEKEEEGGAAQSVGSREDQKWGAWPGWVCFLLRGRETCQLRCSQRSAAFPAPLCRKHLTLLSGLEVGLGQCVEGRPPGDPGAGR